MQHQINKHLCTVSPNDVCTSIPDSNLIHSRKTSLAATVRGAALPRTENGGMCVCLPGYDIYVLGTAFWPIMVAPWYLYIVCCLINISELVLTLDQHGLCFLLSPPKLPQSYRHGDLVVPIIYFNFR